MITHDINRRAQIIQPVSLPRLASSSGLSGRADPGGRPPPSGDPDHSARCRHHGAHASHQERGYWAVRDALAVAAAGVDESLAEAYGLRAAVVAVTAAAVVVVAAAAVAVVVVAAAAVAGALYVLPYDTTYSHMEKVRHDTFEWDN